MTIFLDCDPPYRRTRETLVIRVLRAFRALFGAVKLRGFGPLTKLVHRTFGDHRHSIRFSDDSAFLFSIYDHCWNQFSFNDGWSYEREIYHFLAKLKSVDYLFLDCGANIGYWSVLASSSLLGGKNVIAVEPSYDTFQSLELNRAANGNRFEVVRKAIYHTDGEMVKFSRGFHTGRHIITGDGEPADDVETITLDTLVQSYGIGSRKRKVIKLDIEGGEIAALKGATRLLQEDEVLVLYEDHGKDRMHSVTRYIRDSLGLSAYFIDESGCPILITSYDQIGRLKSNPKKGYNFVFVSQKSTVLREVQAAE